MRAWSQRERLEAATAAFFVAFVCGCTPLHTTTPGQQPSAPHVSQTRGVQQAGPAAFDVPYIPAPTHINLCGEPVPLNREAVDERFDREFTIVVYNHAQVYLWLQRMPRYFPLIEQRLQHYGLPDDLKYVAIAESDLLPDAYSPMGAAGPWQFMAGTGAAYGLSQSQCVDDRYSLLRSTDSAFRLLRNLYDKYHSWPLALAAYNCGGKRLSDAMRGDGTHDYYDLCLPPETERYVFRILAIKAVLSNPGKYGYYLPPQYGYKPFRKDCVTITLPGPMPIRTIADAAGTSFAEIKRLNPMLRSDHIPAGTYEINIPQGTREAFERNFKPAASEILLAEKQAPPVYARSAGHRANVYARSRSVAVARREVRPVRAVSRKVRLVSYRERTLAYRVKPKSRLVEERRRVALHKSRLAKERRRIAAHRSRLARKISRSSRPSARTARAQAYRARQRVRLAKRDPPRAKRKARPAKVISHKLKRKAGHLKSKLHGAERKRDKRLARR